MEDILLAFVMTWQLTPRGNNHSSLNEGVITLMYHIQNKFQVD